MNMFNAPTSPGGHLQNLVHSHLCNLADRMAEFLQADFPITLDLLEGGGS